jgi:DNA repair exonuclease SbcCD ATPase subunit
MSKASEKMAELTLERDNLSLKLDAANEHIERLILANRIDAERFAKEKATADRLQQELTEVEGWRAAAKRLLAAEVKAGMTLKLELEHAKPFEAVGRKAAWHYPRDSRDLCPCCGSEYHRDHYPDCPMPAAQAAHRAENPKRTD